MVDEKHDPRETSGQRPWAWLELFRGFQIAFDFRKLLLAAAGILCMAFLWWVLALVFYSSTKPDWPGTYLDRWPEEDGKATKAWAEFKTDRARWNVMHHAAGPADSKETYDIGDEADTAEEYKRLQAEILQAEKDPRLVGSLSPKARKVKDQIKKPSGELRTWPWFEDRGPNPYLAVSGQAGVVTGRESLPRWLHFARTMVEPFYKFLRPITYMLNANAGPLTRFYALLVIITTLFVWAIFGGAITRMASVEAARREKVGMMEALRFVFVRTPEHGPRAVSFFMAPFFPILFLALLTLLVILYGLFTLIPIFGDIFVAGFFYPLIILAGLLMAVVLIGLVGWPLMASTISTEGTDSWEAVSRSYSYVFQAPWHYLWYGFVALVYGAALVFFINFMGSLMVYLGKWGLQQTPFVQAADREPYYLYVYAPESYQWRELLLAGGTSEGKLGGDPLVSDGQIKDGAWATYVGGMKWYNQIGAFLVSVWIYLVFLMILGFAYSYFWSASSLIYLLMRRKVDDAELDEVYLEDEDQDDFYKEPPKAISVPTPPAPSGGAAVTMVEPPSLRVPTPPPAPPPASPVPLEPRTPPESPSDLPGSSSGNGNPPG